MNGKNQRLLTDILSESYKRTVPVYQKSVLYSWLRPSGLTPRALQSIEDVTNPTNNSINEKCTRIRAAFVGEFDEYMAKSYYIDGPRGGVKKIALPRNLVVWEWKDFFFRYIEMVLPNNPLFWYAVFGSELHAHLHHSAAFGFIGEGIALLVDLL